MKVTQGQIYPAMPVLNRIAQANPGYRTLYRVISLLNEAGKHYAIFEQKRSALVNELGVKQEDGTFKIEEGENLTKFYKEMQEASEHEVTLGCPALKLEDIAKLVPVPPVEGQPEEVEAVEPTAEEVAILMPFIRHEET